MNASTFPELTRRGFLAGTGALVVSFTIPVQAQEATPSAQTPATPVPAKKLPGSLADTPSLDAWIRLDADGSITVFTGKAELGQGTRTSLRQIAAEELEVEPASIKLITADTALTPNEGYTAGSQTIQNSGTAIRYASAQVRQILVAKASEKLGVPADQLKAASGRITGSDGKSVGYGELVVADLLHVDASADTALKSPDSYHAIGKPFARVDIPAKVTGGEAYVQDMRLPGMVHARVVRPPSYSAKLVSVDEAAIKTMPGVVAVIRDGDFLAVVARQEFQAVRAMRAMAAKAKWQEQPVLPDQDNIPAFLERSVAEVGTVTSVGAETAAGAKTLQAQFTRAYQMHGSIGPSAAVALSDKGLITVWTHTQGVYPDRKAIAEMLGVGPEKVRCIHTEGSGCYGHNGADDAAADAALIAQALPGTPVRVQWMRDQEHLWEPYGPGMLTRASATLDAGGKIVNWHYDLWSNSHGTRPGTAGSLIAGRLVAKHFPPDPAKLQISPLGNGDRNAIPLYDVPNQRVNWHFVADMPVRVSSLRGLGAYCNVFSIESFMDELALAAGADPVEYRLRHMKDPRARKVIEVAAQKFGWSNDPMPEGRGRGFAFAKYKNHAAYLAVALEAEVDRDSGAIAISHVVSAVDCGEAVAPDSIVNQTEGGILQSMSWTLYEAVHFDDTRILSADWSAYPILRFSAVPDSVEVHVVDNPGTPYLGVAEAAQGPTAGAIANAFRHAAGKRIYDLPYTRERVKAVLGV
ncbi:molybdopterin-dependent oxidoreductase [Mesorhizobium sp. B292B1B]|uniref:xanthine dehydrogenase family protein molybdopterin-binding subunit n=1 Tax=unclassified Mesorhizobium TaxID=325217 RepID=UPI00112CDDB0|nr:MULTISPECIES: molybdopterin cofactor-binding domain-containing protein [unclassified Mesorhizobium]MCA0012640.1 molybdopterin-dependent oxidoreductase [Mesorhizobium sp. B294B1A1]MCA0037927.1 molybdopterin-dependent oxidoreductase [Mesorhizobium sp. B292B1B]TPM51010.1 xanthine dehydrogenase family protein molybdopterin-binding subunit [Mesorhizobium sp. B2-3-2]